MNSLEKYLEILEDKEFFKNKEIENKENSPLDKFSTSEKTDSKIQ